MKVFYVDPMSYNNLSLYDYSLLKNIKGIDLKYFGNTRYDINNDDFNINKIYSYSDKKNIFKVISYIKSQKNLLKAIRNEKPDIVHFQWFKIPDYDYKFIKRIKQTGAKIVFTAHNILPHDTGDKYYNIYSKIYSAVDSIIVHSEKTGEELTNLFSINSKKIEVIPHGILDFSYVDNKRVESFVFDFKKNNNLNNKTVFSFLGNITKYKGIHLVADAWKDPLLSENKNIVLIIAGKGNSKTLEELGRFKNVIIINRFLENEEFSAFLSLSDFILMPYINISQSGLLLTAINKKKRVIVSNVGGLTEPFKFGEIGYIMDELSSKELVRLLIEAYENSGEYPDNSVWNDIYNYYSWKTIGKKTEKLYLKTIEDR